MPHPVAWLAWLTACACGALPVCAGAQPAAATAPPTAGAAWSSLPVPGGIEAAATAAGIAHRLEPERAMLEIIRHVYDPPKDEPDTSEDLVRRLDTHLATAHAEGASRGAAADVVPLPLQPAFWHDVILQAPVDDARLFGAIVADRRAALFYTGLAHLDEPTLLYFDSHRELARAVARNHAAAFAAFGQSLRIRDNSLEVPGGTKAAALWEAAVGRPVSDTDAFIRQMLARDDGRVAYLYDAVARLDEARQGFALGMTIANPSTRRDRLVALAEHVTRASRSWDLDRHPFARPLQDAVPLLQQVRVTPDGALAPPVSGTFWSEALAGADLPGRGTRPVEGAADAADAAWLAALLNDRNVVVRRARLDALLFAQRRARADTSASQADLLVATRAMARYRLAMLTVERMGVTEAATYAAVARVAESLTSAGARATVAMTQFQGALVLVERSLLGQALDVQTASRLVRSLADLPRADGSRYDGRVASWLGSELLPAVDRAKDEPVAAGERTSERTILRAAAGCATRREGRTAAADTVDWESVTYRMDPCLTATARLERIRLGQRAATLDVALSLARISASLAAPVAPRREDLQRDSRDLESIAASMARSLPRAGEGEEPLSEAVASLTRVAAALPRSAPGFRPARELAPAVDLLTADALASLAYAFALRDPETRLARAPDLARRHDLGLASEVPEERWTTPWHPAVERDQARGQGLLRGSLLGLDVALAEQFLWRLTLAPPPQAPRLATAQKIGFAEGVVLMDPAALTNADRDLIGGAMRRGRQRLEGALSSREAGQIREMAARAGLSGWRRAVLPWLIHTDPDRVKQLLVPREVFALGLDDGPAAAHASLDAWGAPAGALTGCLCLQFPEDTGWERFAGRPAVGALAAYSVDTTLRVAEFLSERRLPASLARDMLAGAIQQVIDEAPALHFDDWFSVARQAGGLPQTALEDLVARVAARGPLVVVEAQRSSTPEEPERVTIVSPQDGTFVSGEVTIEASVTSTQPVTEVAIFADGHLVCRLVEPPYRCQWPAGPRVLARQLRVVASRADGSRLAHTVRTRGLDYAEVVDVDAVQLVAVVTDEGGRFVGGLQRDDFRVLEDGVPQRITTFADERVPVEVVVAIDMSGSMGEAMPRVKESVALFLGALRQGDPVTVVAFNETMFVLSRRDADPKQRRRSVERLSGWGRTALYDTIVQGLQLLAQQPGRKALVLFTDGDDIASAIDLEEVERRVQQSDAALYLIGLGRASKQPRLRETIQRLSVVNGGRAFFPDDIRELDEAFATVRSDLANQYLLGYVPQGDVRDGRWRTLKVEVNRRDVRVRSRQGYRISVEP